MPHDTTAELLMSAARAMRRRFAAALEQYDVTPAQARALRIVAGDCDGAPGPRLSEVAEALRIAPRSATEVVDALERRGLVARETDPADRRATRVVLTDAGRRLQAVLHDARVAESERVLGVLAPADRAELERLLGLVVGSLA